jgi:hypothetical protein
VENALVNFFYALTTIGYILYTGGEASDFQTVIISGLLVLLSFLFTCWFLRMRVEAALEAIAVEHAKKIDLAYPMGEHASLQERFQHYRLNASLIDQFVLHRPEKINRRGLERLALVRTSLLLESILGCAHGLKSAALHAIRAQTVFAWFSRVAWRAVTARIALVDVVLKASDVDAVV